MVVYLLPKIYCVGSLVITCKQILFRISGKQQHMKYIFEPIPKSNPYKRQDSINPYFPLKSQNEDKVPEDAILPKIQVLDLPALKLFCEGCNRQITHQIHIKQESSQWCLNCFSNTEQFSSEYNVVQKLDFPIFQTSWSAYQEALLLWSIERYFSSKKRWGFGNWEQIRQYMCYFGTRFSQDQIQTHYNTFYLLDRTFQPRFSQSLPKRNKGQPNCKGTLPNQVSIATLTTNLPQDSMNFTSRQIDGFSLLDQITTNPLPICQNRVMGFNENRNQFYADFDQNAEKNLCNLQFRDDDLPQEREVKYRIIEEYNQRISKRHEVSDIIVEHKLLDLEYQKQVQENRSQYQKLATSQLKGFLRFSSFDQHNQLVRRVALEKQLKSIIQGLRSFRRTCESGKLKQIYQTICNGSSQHKASFPYNRGRPRKIIHVDNCQKNTSNSSVCNSRTKDQQLLFKKLEINMDDLRSIMNISSNGNNGKAFMYQEVEVTVVERKG